MSTVWPRRLKFGYKEKPKLVHRLDKDTSGV
jgi:23S rRNA-/tRNA-specific pseudouridylate synthase